MPSSSPHDFRYEPALCTVPEGQTLVEWRRDDDGQRPPAVRRGGLLARLRGRREAARRLSGR